MTEALSMHKRTIADASASKWTPRESSVVVGIARCDITPPVGVAARNWGAAQHDRARGVHRPLTATALAFVDGGTVRYLVTADLGWWQSEEAYRAVHDPLCAALGVAEDDLLLHLTHTHSGPSLAERPDLDGAETIAPYRQTLVETVAASARQAARDAAPAVITWASGSCDLAVVRDLACGRRDVVGFDPRAKADNTLLVGRVIREGSIIAVLANYACHPTTLAWENDLLSPDFVGAAREVVEQAVGAPLAFFQGASGELSPREQYVGGTELTDRNGRILGHATLAVLETMGQASTELRLDEIVESGAPLGVWRRWPALPPTISSAQRIDVPVASRAAQTADEILATWTGIDPLAAEERVSRAAQLAASYGPGGPRTHPVYVWRWGDAVLVAHPGEAYSLLQTELRRRHPDFAVVVLNLTNGPGFMYVPDAESYDHDRYQVWQTLLERGSLEQVIEVVDAAISALTAPRKVIE